MTFDPDALVDLVHSDAPLERALAYALPGSPARYAEVWVDKGPTGRRLGSGADERRWYNPATGQVRDQGAMPGSGHEQGARQPEGGEKAPAARQPAAPQPPAHPALAGLQALDADGVSQEHVDDFLGAVEPMDHGEFGQFAQAYRQAGGKMPDGPMKNPQGRKLLEAEDAGLLGMQEGEGGKGEESEGPVAPAEKPAADEGTDQNPIDLDRQKSLTTLRREQPARQDDDSLAPDEIPPRTPTPAPEPARPAAPAGKPDAAEPPPRSPAFRRGRAMRELHQKTPGTVAGTSEDLRKIQNDVKAMSRAELADAYRGLYDAEPDPHLDEAALRDDVFVGVKNGPQARPSRRPQPQRPPAEPMTSPLISGQGQGEALRPAARPASPLAQEYRQLYGVDPDPALGEQALRDDVLAGRAGAAPDRARDEAFRRRKLWEAYQDRQVALPPARTPPAGAEPPAVEPDPALLAGQMLRDAGGPPLDQRELWRLDEQARAVAASEPDPELRRAKLAALAVRFGRQRGKPGAPPPAEQVATPAAEPPPPEQEPKPEPAAPEQTPPEQLKPQPQPTAAGPSGAAAPTPTPARAPAAHELKWTPARSAGHAMRRQAGERGAPDPANVAQMHRHLRWLLEEDPEQVVEFWEGFTGAPHRPAPGRSLSPQDMARKMMQVWSTPRLDGRRLPAAPQVKWDVKDAVDDGMLLSDTPEPPEGSPDLLGGPPEPPAPQAPQPTAPEGSPAGEAPESSPQPQDLEALRRRLRDLGREAMRLEGRPDEPSARRRAELIGEYDRLDERLRDLSRRAVEREARGESRGVFESAMRRLEATPPAPPPPAGPRAATPIGATVEAAGGGRFAYRGFDDPAQEAEGMAAGRRLHFLAASADDPDADRLVNSYPGFVQIESPMPAGAAEVGTNRSLRGRIDRRAVRRAFVRTDYFDADPEELADQVAMVRRLYPDAEILAVAADPADPDRRRVVEPPESWRQFVSPPSGAVAPPEAGQEPEPPKPGEVEAPDAPAPAEAEVVPPDEGAAPEAGESWRAEPSRDEERPHLERLHQRLRDNPNLSDPQRKAYAAAGAKALSRMTAQGLARYGAGAAQVDFYPDAKSLREATAELVAPEQRDGVRRSRRIAGYQRHGPAGGRLMLDGGNAKDLDGPFGSPASPDDPTAVYAHEMGHAVDGPDLELSSGDPEWAQAYRAEIAGGQLTKYAVQKKRPRHERLAEGFAEFHGALTSGLYEPAALARHFPKAYAFFVKHGLAEPAEPDHAAPRPDVAETFDRRVALGGDGVSHLDVQIGVAPVAAAPSAEPAPEAGAVAPAPRTEPGAPAVAPAPRPAGQAGPADAPAQEPQREVAPDSGAPAPKAVYDGSFGEWLRDVKGLGGASGLSDREQRALYKEYEEARRPAEWQSDEPAGERGAAGDAPARPSPGEDDYVRRELERLGGVPRADVPDEVRRRTAELAQDGPFRIEALARLLGVPAFGAAARTPQAKAELARLRASLDSLVGDGVLLSPHPGSYALPDEEGAAERLAGAVAPTQRSDERQAPPVAAPPLPPHKQSKPGEAAPTQPDPDPLPGESLADYLQRVSRGQALAGPRTAALRARHEQAQPKAPQAAPQQPEPAPAAEPPAGEFARLSRLSEPELLELAKSRGVDANAALNEARAASTWNWEGAHVNRAVVDQERRRALAAAVAAAGQGGQKAGAPVLGMASPREKKPSDRLIDRVSPGGDLFGQAQEAGKGDGKFSSFEAVGGMLGGLSDEDLLARARREGWFHPQPGTEDLPADFQAGRVRRELMRRLDDAFRREWAKTTAARREVEAKAQRERRLAALEQKRLARGGGDYPRRQELASVYDAVESSPHLSAEQKRSYAQAMDRAAHRVPAPAMKRLADNLAGASFYATTDDVGPGALRAAVAALEARGGLNPDEQKALEDARRMLASGEFQVGGAFDALGGLLHLDGDYLGVNDEPGRHGEKGGVLAHEVYAHELTHVIDGKMGVAGGRLSQSDEWKRIWQEEIAVEGADSLLTSGSEPPLTAYAMSKPEEGFAEFGRLLYGSDVPSKQIRVEFPQAYGYFASRGLAPQDEGERSGEPIAEAFDQRVELPGGGHLDGRRRRGGGRKKKPAPPPAPAEGDDGPLDLGLLGMQAPPGNPGAAAPAGEPPADALRRRYLLLAQDAQRRGDHAGALIYRRQADA